MKTKPLGVMLLAGTKAGAMALPFLCSYFMEPCTGL